MPVDRANEGVTLVVAGSPPDGSSLCAAPGLVVENSIALGLADVLFGSLSRSDSPAVPCSSRLRVAPLAAESSRTEDGQHPERKQRCRGWLGDNRYPQLLVQSSHIQELVAWTQESHISAGDQQFVVGRI